MIRTRDAIPSDARGVTEVRYKTWMSTYPKVYPIVTQEDIERKFANFESLVKQMKASISKNRSDKKFVVAEDNNRIVGFVIASKELNKNREIKALYVSDDYQGQGVGKKLMRVALEWLDAEKYLVVVEVVSTNEPAVKFYKNLGFQKSRSLPTPSKEEAPDYLPMPHIEMIRKPDSID